METIRSVNANIQCHA